MLGNICVGQQHIVHIRCMDCVGVAYFSTYAKDKSEIEWVNIE